MPAAYAFTYTAHIPRYTLPRTASRLWSSADKPTPSGYVPPREDPSPLSANKPLYPKLGDIVRYYDLDGGRADGEVLVGKISFLQKQIGTENDWLVELTELENVGDGYYAEYPSRKKQFKKATRPLEEISPIAASFVRSESAYKIPCQVGSQDIIVKAEQYTIEGFLGPFGGDENEIDLEAIQEDAELYGKLKTQLLRNAALAGVVGTLIADFTKGAEDAAIYAAGAAAGVGYLFFLALKTDTLGSQSAKLGSNISNFRFVLPFLVLVGVAVYNMGLGAGSPVTSPGIMSSVTPEQFAAAIIGFLTYRLPLFASQLSPLIKESAGGVLPGSAGVALQLASATDAVVDQENIEDLIPVLLVSGPPGTGKGELVKRLIDESDGRFVAPKLVDRIQDGTTFERLQRREEFLQENERFGLTKDGILSAAGESKEKAVVVDADVELAKKLTKISGARLIGVWVGLDSMEKFESSLEEQIDSGDIPVPPDESKESVIRAKVREIVTDIEYGVVSGVFEFTILNEDFDSSLEQLKFAAEYCFK